MNGENTGMYKKRMRKLLSWAKPSIDKHKKATNSLILEGRYDNNAVTNGWFYKCDICGADLEIRMINKFGHALLDESFVKCPVCNNTRNAFNINYFLN